MSRVLVFRASDDRLERLSLAADTLDEATLQTAHGVYTVLRLYAGRRTFRLNQHWARLRNSAESLGRRFTLSDEWLRAALRRAIEASGMETARVRLAVPFDAPHTAIISLEPFTSPADDLYTKGVRVGLVKGRRESPLAKNSHFIEWRNQITASQPATLYEIMLVDYDGSISEGTGSNFYAVIDGKLRTAREGMLEGIARGVLLDIALPIIPVVLESVHVGDLSTASEAMLTSASRGVVPIVEVGDMVIDGGSPGAVSKALKAAYDARVESELEVV